MAFDNAKEVAKRKEFIHGLVSQDDTFAVSGFNAVKTEDLIFRLEAIENRSFLAIWLIWYEIRKRFKSDKLLGQYLNDLQRTYDIVVPTQGDRNRFAWAGKFCADYNITDLSVLGIKLSSLYDLSAPKNADVANKVFHAVKLSPVQQKRYSVAEVRRMIEEAKSITVQKEPEKPEPVAIDYDKRSLRIIPVIDNIAQDDTIESIGELVEDELDKDEYVPPVTLSLPETVSMVNYNKVFSQMKPEIEEVVDRRTGDRRSSGIGHDDVFRLSSVNDEDLLLELATRRVDYLSDKEIVSELIMISERYDKSHSELVKIFKDCEKFESKLCA